jgi:hypothetical protein
MHTTLRAQTSFKLDIESYYYYYYYYYYYKVSAFKHESWISSFEAEYFHPYL